MKKTQEIIGLPIISISDGMEVGKVKSVIINAETGTIDYIIADSGAQVLSVKVIPTSDVLGIGSYALTIENEGVISDISKIPSAINLLQKNIQVRGTKVLTKKGSLIGEIGDIYIEESDGCKIIGLEFIADITQRKVRIIPRDTVITFGKNLVVVKDDVEGSLVDRPSQLGWGEKPAEPEKKNMVNSDWTYKEQPVAKADEVIANIGDTYYMEDEAASEDTGILQPELNTPSAEKEAPAEGGMFHSSLSSEQPVQSPVDNTKQVSAANLFEQRQRQYLNGRRVTKTITDGYGNVIVEEGMIITDEIIDEAKAKGKIIELVMNNKA